METYKQALYGASILQYLQTLHFLGQYEYEMSIPCIKCDPDEECGMLSFIRCVETYDGVMRCPWFLMGECTGDCGFAHLEPVNKDIGGKCHLTKRQVPELPSDVWGIIIRILESDNSNPTEFPAVSIFGRSALSAVRQYAQSVLKSSVYKDIRQTVYYGKCSISVAPLFSIHKGKVYLGEKVRAIISHPNDPSPIQLVKIYGTCLFHDSLYCQLIYLGNRGNSGIVVTELVGDDYHREDLLTL